jgi:uncharacterized protein (DUF433 family)
MRVRAAKLPNIKSALGSIDGQNQTIQIHRMSLADAPVEIGAFIARKPGIKNGSPHIAGTGILVRTIARWNQAGVSPEEIAAKYHSLRLEQVHAALAYYYANRREIDRELDQLEREADKLQAEATRQM